MQTNKIGSIGAAIALVLIILGGFYYATHRTRPSSPPPPASLNAIDVAKEGLQLGEVFKLVKTNDPYSQNYIGDPFVYLGVIGFSHTAEPKHGEFSLPLNQQADYFVDVKKSRTTNNGYAFVDTGQEVAWSQKISLNNTTVQTDLIKNTWVYQLEDMAGKDKGKYLYVANLFDMLHNVNPKFEVPSGTRYYHYTSWAE